jgi:Uma2 family endonuclease
MVDCTTIDEDEMNADDDCLIVEVTSPSTPVTDRREKLVSYKKLPALRAYLIVDQRRRRVERHVRNEAGEWWQSLVTGDESIALPCVDLTLTLGEIYEGVRAPAVSEPPPGYGAGEWYTDEEYAEEEA